MSKHVGMTQELKDKYLNMFWDYLEDCGLFPGYWDLYAGADLIYDYACERDFDVPDRFVEYPMMVRSYVMVATCVDSSECVAGGAWHGLG